MTHRVKTFHEFLDGFGVTDFDIRPLSEKRPQCANKVNALFIHVLEHILIMEKMNEPINI